MADALDEEWWMDSEKQEKKTIPGDREKKKAKKRKSHNNIEEHVTEPEEHEGEGVKKKKKRKRRPKIEDVTLELHGTAVTDTLWNTFCAKCAGKLTTLELDDLKIDDSCCLMEDSVHTGDAAELSTYLNKVIPDWSKQVNKLNKKGITASPILLLLTSGAVRAVELNKSLDKFKADGRIVKLFAKHLKIEEQMKFLDSKVVHAGIGTPNRVLKLIRNESLKTSRLKYVIFDWTWRDKKLRSIMDIPEVRDDLNHLLQDLVFPLAKAGKLLIGLF